MANSLGKVKYSKMDRYLWDWFTNLDAYGLDYPYPNKVIASK